MKNKKNEDKAEDVVVDEAGMETEATDVEDSVENEIVSISKKELEKLQNENAELKDRAIRSMAEFDNFRKRTIKEKSNMYGDGVVSVVEKLIPVVDNFDRAMAHEKNTDDNFYKGVDMIYRQFNELLKELGVEQIQSVGEVFDPELHFAVAHEESDEYGENVIIEELQKGYKYKDKVIRCSMVKVAN